MARKKLSLENGERKDMDNLSDQNNNSKELEKEMEKLKEENLKLRDLLDIYEIQDRLENNKIYRYEILRRITGAREELSSIGKGIKNLVKVLAVANDVDIEDKTD